MQPPVDRPSGRYGQQETECCGKQILPGGKTSTAHEFCGQAAGKGKAAGRGHSAIIPKH